ncbi:hypothetical protein Ancab_030230 [Ancistrocladus abbreviatus]
MDPNSITHLPPPPPPPPPPTQSPSIFHFPSHNSSGGAGTNFPVIAIALIGILATAFLLVSYYVFVIKCCLYWHRIDFLRRFSSRRQPHNTNPSSIVYSPAIIVSRGLDESVIQSIPIIRFRKEARKVSQSGDEGCYYECAVCLSEFKEGEKLRVIPNCCHAFHIDCIDVWLQTSANCPLCRSSISSNTLLAIDQTIAPSSSPQYPTPNSDTFGGNDEDYVVIELQENNLDEPRLVSRTERLKSGELSSLSMGSPPLKAEQRDDSVSQKLQLQKGVHNRKRQKKLQHVSSMGDECIDIRENDDEFRIHPIRRSISMDSSSDRLLYLQIQEILQQRQQDSREVNEGCSSR